MWVRYSVATAIIVILGGLAFRLVGQSPRVVDFLVATEGEMRKVTLIFEHAGRVEVEFMIDPPMGEDMGDMDHSTMDMGEGSGG
jgi:hypothetical protein